MPPLNCGLGRRLGDYYQDFSPAVHLVEAGYHGELDPEGVPLIRAAGGGGAHSAIITAQYALANLILAQRGDSPRLGVARRQLDSLVATQAPAGESAGCWPLRFDNMKYPWLKAPWTSALASGNAMSALLRGWERFGDDTYLTAATAAYRALHSHREGLPICIDAAEELWYEEYPAEVPLHVLNGHVYALLGVLDYARISDDAEAHARWRRAAATLLSRLADYDLGYWSAYELRWREPAALHYQKNIHVPQLRILAALTGAGAFAEVADRWEGYVESRTSRLRWMLGVRLHRWRAHPPWVAGGAPR
jgi:hypothetical protein